jgi:hypothetical protein
LQRSDIVYVDASFALHGRNERDVTVRANMGRGQATGFVCAGVDGNSVDLGSGAADYKAPPRQNLGKLIDRLAIREARGRQRGNGFDGAGQ